MRYPYTRIAWNVPLRPYLQVSLRNGFHTTSPVYALVDSGADYSIFPYDLATTYLKLDLNHAEQWAFQGTTGEEQVAYLTTVELNILNADKTRSDFQFSTKIGFCPSFKFAGGVLLGQQGFMSLFKTTFNQPEDYFEIEEFQKTLLQRS
jgi:hypothetical protein